MRTYICGRGRRRGVREEEEEEEDDVKCIE